MPICSAALNQPRGIFPKPPGLSKGLLLPNDRYELQCRQAGAPYQIPEIICTVCEASNNSMFCYITYFGLYALLFVALCVSLRSQCSGRLQLGDTKIRPTLYLATLYIAMTTKMLRMVVLLVYARSLARSLCTLHLLLQLATPSDVLSAKPQHHTHLMHTCIHVCNAPCQIQTPTNTHTLVVKRALICCHTEKTLYNMDLITSLSDSVQSNTSIYFN